MERELFLKTVLVLILVAALSLFGTVMSALDRAAENVGRADPGWQFLCMDDVRVKV